MEAVPLTDAVSEAEAVVVGLVVDVPEEEVVVVEEP